MHKYEEYPEGEKIKSIFEVRLKGIKLDGGFGIIYRCNNLDPHSVIKKVVVKSILRSHWDHEKMGEIKKENPNLYADILNRCFKVDEAITRGQYLYLSCIREARVLKQLKGCPGVPLYIDSWENESGQSFLVMEEIINGKNLAGDLKSLSGQPHYSGLSVLQCLHIAISVCNTMIWIDKEVIPKYCAEHKDDPVKYFVHRDIKPANLLITPQNEIILIDFGNSKFSGKLDLTMFASENTKTGSDLYSPPEFHVKGKFEHFDAKSDIYSLGATLYHLLTGNDIKELKLDVGISVIAKVSVRLSEILSKCLQYEELDRYHSFFALKKDLIILTEQIKMGLVDINENARCSQCGYISRKHIYPDPEKIGIRFASVKEGEFIEGCSDSQLGKMFRKFPNKVEYLRHLIPFVEKRKNLAAYEISLTPVTNKQYQSFLKVSGMPYPSHWTENSDTPFGVCKENFPMVNLSYKVAEEFCHYFGLRMPTGEEFEKAARGVTGKQFPWGEEFNKDYCNCAEANSTGLVSVDNYPNGKSEYGVLQMVGNISEWIDQNHPDSKEGMVVYKYIVGGSFRETCELSGLPFLRDFADKVNKKFEHVGFRAVRNSSVSGNALEKCPLCEEGHLEAFDINSINLPDSQLNWKGFFEKRKVES